MRDHKDPSIETLRGLACLFMVASHVIGQDPTTGLKVGDASYFRYFYETFKYYRMPLFTVISGFVYSLRPVVSGRVLDFLKGKSRRILLPFFFVSSLQFLMRIVLPGLNKTVRLQDMWTIYIYPFDQFWFLEALFLVFLAVVLLETSGLLKTPSRWFACFVLSVSLTYFIPWTPYTFGLRDSLYLFPFFILGCGLNRFENFLFRPHILRPALVFLLAGIALQQLCWFNLVPLIVEKRGPFGICLGLVGIALLFYVRPTVRWLARLGPYAYSIYLFHVLFAAGSRLVLKVPKNHNVLGVLIVTSVIGLLGPVLIEKILEKKAILRTIFLGMR